MSGFGLGPLPRNYDAALRDARDKKASVRLSAVKDLAVHAGGVSGARAVGALLDTLAGDASAEVRGAAAVALADSGSRSAVDGLLAAAEDASDHVRQMALLALGEVSSPGDAKVADAIRRALASDHAPLRFQALIAANRTNADVAASALIAATRDPDAEVRHLAFRLLEERATDDADVVRIDPAVARAARHALDDDSFAVRLGAAILLARSGDASGKAVIVRAVDGVRDRLDPEDVGAAIGLVADLALAEARRGLARRAFGGLFGRDPFAYEARIALARLGDPRARDSIVRGLSSWSRDTRTLYAVAAGRARLVEARERLAQMRGNSGLAEPEAVEEALDRIAQGVAR